MGKRQANRNLLLLVLAVAVLLVLVFVQKADKESKGKPEALFPGLNIDDLISVTVSHKERIVLQREKNAWMITAPGRYRADLMETVKFLKNLTGLRYFRSFPAKNDQLSRFKLDKPDTIITIRTGGKEIRLLTGVDLETGAGNTTRSLTYVTVAGSGRVYTVETPHVTRLQLGLNSIRNKYVLNFERRDLAAVEFDYNGRRLAFRNDEKKGWVDAAGRKIVRTKLMTFLVDFYRFKVDEFESDRANPAVYGVRPGRNYLTVRLRSGGRDEVKTIRFGRERKGHAMRYCTVTGDPGVYRIGLYRFERLNKQYSDFLPAPPVSNTAPKGAK